MLKWRRLHPQATRASFSTPTAPPLATGTPSGCAPYDGVDGTYTAPFTSAPDRNGNTYQFAINWASYGDMGSGVIARGHGLDATELVPATGIYNTDIYRMFYRVLFGEEIPREEPVATPDALGTR